MEDQTHKNGTKIYCWVYMLYFCYPVPQDRNYYHSHFTELKQRHPEVEYLTHGCTAKNKKAGSKVRSTWLQNLHSTMIQPHQEFKCPHNPTSFISHHIFFCSLNKPCTCLHVSLCFYHSLHLGGPLHLLYLSKSCQPSRPVQIPCLPGLQH